MTFSTAPWMPSRRDVVADDLVPVLLLGAVVAQHTQAARDLRVIRDDRPALAVRAEVLARVEAEAAGACERADAAALVAGAVRLRRVLDDEEVVTVCHFEDGVEVCGLTVEVDGYNGARARGDGRLYLVRVDVEVEGSQSTKTGVAPAVETASAVAKKVLAGTMTSSACADAAGLQRELNRGRAVRDADALCGADVLRERALEGLDLAAQNEGRRVEHPLDGRVNLGLNRKVLRL